MRSLTLARDELRAGRTRAAKRIAEQVLAEMPDSVPALQILAEVEQGQGAPDRAAEHLAHAARIEPDNAPVLSSLLQLNRTLGRFDTALAAAHRLCALSPDDPQLLCDLAQVHLERAERLFDGMLPSEAPAEGGAALDGRSDLAAAKSTLQQALRLRPGFAVAKRALAVCHAGLNEMYEACVQAGEYMQHQRDEATFSMTHDFVVRMQLAKVLRETPEAVPGVAANTEAVDRVRRQLSADILGPCAIFFHVDAGDKHPYLRDDSAPQKHKVDYLSTLAAAARCARLTQPGATILLLTDETTTFDRSDFADYVIRLPRAPDHLMYARMCAYRAVVQSGRLKGPILFLDTDLCLNHDFSALFDGSFDIALAYRSSIRFPLMPLNEGLILAAPHRPDATIRFFDQCVALYDWLADQPSVQARYPFGARYWRGGQIALAAFARWRVPPYTPEAVELGGVRCRFLPCHTYNRPVSPDERLAELGSVWGLHFKGLFPKGRMEQFLKQVEKRSRV